MKDFFAFFLFLIFNFFFFLFLLISSLILSISFSSLNSLSFKSSLSFNNFYNDNGAKYIGEMKNGLKEGKGILFYDKNNEKKRIKYEGDFKNDKEKEKELCIGIMVIDIKEIGKMA